MSTDAGPGMPRGQQAKGAIERGYSKNLLHLPRVHKLSVGSMHEFLCGVVLLGGLNTILLKRTRHTSLQNP
eukprot:6013547-Amphidinium_carterae.2